MGIFDSRKPKFKNCKEAVAALFELQPRFDESDKERFKKSNMDKILSEVESYLNGEVKDAMLTYSLAGAWRSYTSLHIRGDDRKQFLEKIIKYLKQAIRIARSQLPVCFRAKRRAYIENLDQITIAGTLGSILVNEAMVRNLGEAENILAFVAENTEEYEPCLCDYADLYYKKRDYLKSAKVALDAYGRAKNSAEWKNNIPPAPLIITAKAYRALGREAKKKGDIKKAAEWHQKIVELGIATDNDQKILIRLKRGI